MNGARRVPFPKWLDQARRAQARRWARMTPEEIAAEIHRGAEEARKMVAGAARHRSRGSSHPKKGSYAA